MLGGVHCSQEADIVEQESKRLAVVSPEQDQGLKAQQEAAWRRLEALAERNAHLGPDVVLAEATEEVEAVRQERYERRQATESQLT